MEKRRSPREIIESTDPRYEHGYLRYAGEELQDITLPESKKHEVNIDAKKYVKIMNRKDYKHPYYFYHNHPRRHLPFTLWNVGASPSSGDMNCFIDEPKQKSMYIFQRDSKTGKVEGVYVLRKPKYFGKKKEPQLMTYTDMFNNRVRRYISPKRATRLLAEEHGLKYRFVPAKGYKLNWRGIFVKNKESWIEQKVAAIFIGVGFIASLLLLSTNITGFTILNLNQTNSNIIGAFLFIASLFGLFFLNRRRK